MPVLRSILVIVAGSIFLVAELSGFPQSSFESPVADGFFSGTVTESGEDTIQVTRSVLGKKAVMRRFVITPETKVEGEIRVRARVTVRFLAEEQADRAVHIIVRNRRNAR